MSAALRGFRFRRAMLTGFFPPNLLLKSLTAPTALAGERGSGPGGWTSCSGRIAAEHPVARSSRRCRDRIDRAGTRRWRGADIDTARIVPVDRPVPCGYSGPITGGAQEQGVGGPGEGHPVLGFDDPDDVHPDFQVAGRLTDRPFSSMRSLIRSPIRSRRPPDTITVTWDPSGRSSAATAGARGCAGRIAKSTCGSHRRRRGGASALVAAARLVSFDLGVYSLLFGRFVNTRMRAQHRPRDVFHLISLHGLGRPGSSTLYDTIRRHCTMASP